MDGVTEAAAADPSPHTYSQVVFMDIPHSYPPSTPITCCYTFSAALKPQSRDWVGIFKVGWSTTKEYYTFVWVEPSQDVECQQTMTRRAVFKDYYLPKDEVEFYQFCYIDSTGQVRGASTSFCFRSPAEQSLESNTDDDLLVITTQDQVEQSQREKAELQKELQQLRAENETLKSTLQKEQKETMSFKVCSSRFSSHLLIVQERSFTLNFDKMTQLTNKTNLVKEMDQIREENEQLKNMLQLQEKENDRLKEEMVIQMTKQMEIQQHNFTEQEKQSQSLKSLKANEGKYDRALMKINQLKEERVELKKKTEAQSEEIERLKVKLRKGERELLKTADSIPLLQTDLQNSEKEKERLVAVLQKLQNLGDGMDEVKKENQELYRRLSQQETDQISPQDNLKVQSSAESEYMQPDILSPAGDTSATRDKLESQKEAENVYENIGGDEELREARTVYFCLQQSLVCRHCQESFPGITRNELEQHEQSHRVCPFCTMICDNMEQSIFEDHVYGHEL
ncbi:calcium-binding and coiled-coil domain-containing protein 2 [Xenentodon cancila]